MTREEFINNQKNRGVRYDEILAILELFEKVHKHYPNIKLDEYLEGLIKKQEEADRDPGNLFSVD